MNVKDKLYESCIVPVVVLDKAEDAVPCAKALLEGGIKVMEITFRTACARDAINLVSENVKEMCVGAGTVINVEQAKNAVKAGANFIVSPGYDEETVSWCCDNNIPVVPGCLTPTEIMMALKHDLSIVKFFPSSNYGGLYTMKALSGPFPGLKFIPTGGINIDNLSEYAQSPFIFAVGGSWICSKKDINAHNFDKITELSKEARKVFMGYEIAHFGINTPNEDVAEELMSTLSGLFNLNEKRGNSSNFASDRIEIMKSMYKGSNGHIGIKTNRAHIAIKELLDKGYTLDADTVKEKDGLMTMAYMKEELGGFAFHIIQR